MIRNLLLTSALLATSFSSGCAQESVDEPTRAQTEEIVREYILANPEIIEEALIALNQKREAEEEEKSRIAVKANAELLFEAASDYSVGPDDAPVTVVEFFDYRCGPCRASMKTVTALPDRFDGQVRVVFKEFPILSPESRKAAIATLAAGRQGKYIEMHQAFMQSPSDFKEADLVAVAQDLDLDMAQWAADRADESLEAQVDATYQLAATIGANATPTFVVGDTLFSGLNRARLETLIAEGIASAG